MGKDHGCPEVSSPRIPDRLLTPDSPPPSAPSICEGELDQLCARRLVFVANDRQHVGGLVASKNLHDLGFDQAGTQLPHQYVVGGVVLDPQIEHRRVAEVADPDISATWRRLLIHPRRQRIRGHLVDNDQPSLPRLVLLSLDLPGRGQCSALILPSFPLLSCYPQGSKSCDRTESTQPGGNGPEVPAPTTGVQIDGLGHS